MKTIKNYLIHRFAAILLMMVFVSGVSIAQPTATISNVTSTSFKVSWTSVPSSFTYLVDVAVTTGFSPTVYSGSFSSTATNATISVPAGAYFVRVGSIVGSGNPQYSASVPVTLPVSIPVASSASSVTSSSFTANWGAVSGATSYLMDVSLTSDFAQKISGYNNLNISTASVIVSGVTSGTTYYYRVKAQNSSTVSAYSTPVTVLTISSIPPVLPGSSVAWDSFTANWQPATGASGYKLDVSLVNDFSTMVSGYADRLVNATSLSLTGITPHTPYYYRVRATNVSGTSPSSTVVQVLPLDFNYTRSVQVMAAGKKTQTDIENSTLTERITKFDFVDGLGRHLQSVAQQQSPLQKDIVQPVEYDALGREAKKYLPYASDEANGWIKISALADIHNAGGTPQTIYRTGKQYQFYQTGGTVASDQFPMAETRFEASPLSRALEQGAPGATWQPDGSDLYTSTDHTIKKAYERNGAGEVLQFDYVSPSVTYPLGFIKLSKRAYYPANQLTRSRTKDEQGNEVIEYHDKQGHVIMKKVQAPASTYAQTYYLYDDYSQLVTVLQPEGVAGILSKLSPIWANIVGVSVNATTNSITKTAAANYGNAGATSTIASETLAAGTDGWVEMTAGETNTSRMIGLAASNVNNGTSIQFALELRNDGNIYVWENNVAGANLGAYVSGTVVRVSREGSQIKYYVDGVYKQTSATASTGTLIVDAALNQTGATIQNVNFSFKVNVALQSTLTSYAFQYTYDSRHRMTQKQVPGAQVVYMVYDNRDRLVLTQDGNQRPGKQWHFTKYDVLNRPVLTGMLKTNVIVDQPTMQTRVNNYYAGLTGSQNWFEIYQGSGVHGYTNNSYPQTDTLNNYLTVTYYDNYTFKSLFTNTSAFDYLSTELDGTGGYTAQEPGTNPNVAGLVTGGKVRMLATGTWLKSIHYYDSKYRGIQIIADNPKGHEVTTTTYDFVGRPLRVKTSLHTGQPITWTNMTGVQVQGDGLTCTGTTNWGQAATSVQTLPASTDGWTEVTAPEVATNFYIGLADQYISTATASIDYAMQVGGGRITVYENGVQKFSFVNTTAGDVMRIERVNGIVYYKKNGAIIYTSAASSTTSLMTYVCMLNTGSKIYRPRVSNTFSAPTGLVAASSFVKRFTYDHAGRLTDTWHKLNSGSEILLTHNAYNELGQLIDKKLHSTNVTASDAKQSVDYRYTIRGWLSSVNNAELANNATNDDTGDLFGMNLAYNDDLGTGNTANLQYNGNINAIKWSSGLGLGAIKQMAYNFTYDPMSRLSGASSLQAATLNTWTTGQYDENGLSYDLNGNIKTLQRKGAGAVTIDNLTYNYGTTASNQLQFVTDAAAATDKAKGFNDGNTSGNDYTYDANGNMTLDKNKNITSAITYNYLNLPEKVIRNGSTDYIQYYYDATGTKRGQLLNMGNQQKWTDYIGAWIFENNELQFIQHDEGRIVITSQQKLYTNSCNAVTADMIPTASTTLSTQTINGENYVKVTTAAGVAMTKLGVMLNTPYTVAEGERYLYRVKGYFTSVQLSLYVKGNSADLVWPGTDMPRTAINETWVENTFTIPIGTTQVTLGLLWNNPSTAGDFFYINEIEFYKLGTTAAPEYQYNLKDHLGNVRLTFTTQNTTKTYTAGFETANQGTESANFNNYPTGAYVNTAAINARTGTNSQYLSGGLHGQVGVAKSFAVMPGDQLQIQTYAKFSTPSSTGSNLAGFASALLGAFNLAAPVGGEAGTASAALNTWGGLEAGGNGNGSTAPIKVFVNIILFDKNYNFLDVSYQAVSTSGALLSASYTVKEPGYAYMYISNENPTLVDVYVDDVTMSVTPSPIVQQTDYYPFGLAFNEYDRESNIHNRYLFNKGTERQEDLGLNVYQTHYRMYDPALGRWWQEDPRADIPSQIELTPYNFGDDDPILKNDPNGDCPVCVILAIAALILDANFAEAPGVDQSPAALQRAQENRNYQRDVNGIVTTVVNPGNSAKQFLGKAVGKIGRSQMRTSTSTTPQPSAPTTPRTPVKTVQTSREARRESMRQQKIPTSQQPKSQSKNNSGREYSYQTKGEGGKNETKSVQQQTKDSNHQEQPHWEAGTVKTDESGNVRTNDYGRPKLDNDKSKVNYTTK